MQARRPRIVTFEELEEWLRNLPLWEAEIESAGGAKGGEQIAPGSSRGSGGSGSAIEREAIRTAELSNRVDVIRTGLSGLSDVLQEFVQAAYLDDTGDKTLGRSILATCRLLGITRTDFYQMRERVMIPILCELYYRRADPGKPYNYCDCDRLTGR